MAFTSGQAEMNVTPLIDVLLVLIIIFLIIVPVAPTGEEANIPREPNGESVKTPERTIVIQVAAKGKEAELRINEEVVKWDDLRMRLFDIFKTRAEKVAFVRADSDVEFEQVAQAIDIAHSAGVANIGLMR